jgi:hypothetical protein
VEETAVQRMLPYFTLAYMKAHLDRYQPISVQWRNEFRFIRKGTVGDHTTLFDSAMLERFHQSVRRVFPEGLPSWAVDAADVGGLAV